MRWKTLLNILNKNTICNNDLHHLAEKHGAHIDYAHLPQTTAVALKYGDTFFIGMDYSVPENSAEERMILAHEIGHIETDAFYGMRAPAPVRAAAEIQAERWAVKKLVPKQRFTCLLKQGLEAWELAEHFNVSEAFIRKAYHLYFECGMQGD